MNRRTFLVGTAAGAAAVAGVESASFAQNRPGAGPGRGGAEAGRGRRGRGPADVPAAKLARVSIMTFDFKSIIRLPGRTPTPEHTVDVMDLPQYYTDHYGIPNIEFQHITHQGGDRPGFIKELKARLDAQKMRMMQINLEFGQENISSPDAAMRQKAVDHTKQWIDIATQFNCPRVMLNQQQNQTRRARAYTVAAWKAMADYGRPKNVRVSASRAAAAGGAGRQRPSPRRGRQPGSSS